MAAIKRDSGRACGCDPSLQRDGRVKGHACEGHAKYEDASSVDVGIDEPIVTVRGPLGGHIRLLSTVGGQQVEFWFDRFEAEDLIYEIQRRLAPRA